MDLLNIKPNVVGKGVAGKYFLFYGEPSTRKTSVATMFPKSLLLATEIGYSLLDGVHALPIKSWADFREVVRELKRPEVQESYKTIVIDTVGLLTDMCMKYICDTNGVAQLSEIPWGQGWTLFKKEFRTQINTVAQMGYGIVLIAHSDTKRDNETGAIISATPMMDKKPRESVIALVDFILYLQKEVKDGNSNETTVYAYSNLASGIESKSRARYLSPRFEFNYENLEKEIGLAVEKIGSSGISDEVVNPYAMENTPFDELKAEAIALATELVNNPKTNELTNSALLTIMKGIKVSQATSADYEKLSALKEALIEIKEGI